MTPMTLQSPVPFGTVETVAPTALRTVLHVGCGGANPEKVPDAFFPRTLWHELRLDIDPEVTPDIVASITDMPMVGTGSVDGVWSAHNLEHLAAHEVPLALAEFLRVLRPGGFLALTLPDLQQVAALVADGLLEDPAYISLAGPIAPLDMLYGFRPSIARGNAFMGHRTGFTAKTLAVHLTQAGFSGVDVVRDGKFALWAKGVKPA